MAWALERAANPTVLRLHATLELTRGTIETCPPASAPLPLRRLLGIAAVRSVDLHRYRVRLNLTPALIGAFQYVPFHGVVKAIRARVLFPPPPYA